MPKFKKTINIYLVNNPQKKADKKTIAYQYAMGLFLFCLGIVLSLPLVPGPGFLLIITGLLILRVPGSNKFIDYLNTKRFFKRLKLWLKLKFNIKLVTEHK